MSLPQPAPPSAGGALRHSLRITAIGTTAAHAEELYEATRDAVLHA